MNHQDQTNDHDNDEEVGGDAVAVLVQPNSNSNNNGVVVEDEAMMDLEGEEEEEDEEEDHLNRNNNMSGTTLRPELPGCEYTEQEENWAWEIVRAIEGRHCSDISICSDFEYMVLGICAQGDVQKALRSARGMQVFRETYNVQDTLEECMDIIQQFIALQPGVLLHLDILDSQRGEGLAVWNMGAIVPARTDTEAKFRVHILACYYLITILNPDFRACREGIYVLVEGKDMCWENFNPDFEYRFHHQLWMHLPIKAKRFMVYNTNSVVTMVWGLLKRLMTQHWHAVEMGCQIEWDAHHDNPKLSLLDLYLLPDYDTAMQHCLQRARSMAERRFRNQEEFRL